jgi:hypothetical protein
LALPKNCRSEMYCLPRPGQIASVYANNPAYHFDPGINRGTANLAL